MKYKNGTRIKMVKQYDDAKEGMLGKIISHYWDDEYVIEFDAEFLGGHTCEDTCKDGYGHYVRAKYFKVLNNNKRIS